MNTINIRLIEAKDNLIIESIIRSCLIEYGGNHAGTAWTDPNLGNFSEVYNTKTSAYWVVEEDNIILGGVGIGPLIDYPTICELQKMYFIPSARHLGYARQVLQVALEFAQIHYSACYIETLDNMVEAQRFYEKNGFIRLDTTLGSTGHDACDVRYILYF